MISNTAEIRTSGRSSRQVWGAFFLTKNRSNMFLVACKGCWLTQVTSHFKLVHSMGQPYIPSVMLLGTWPTFFFLFSTDMYLYDHMTSTHMTAYLYNRATSSGTPLFPSFVRFLLFPPYGSLWPPLFVTLLFCDPYCSWCHCSPYLYA